MVFVENQQENKMARLPMPVADYAKFVQQLAHLSRVVDVDLARSDEWKKSTKKTINRLIRDLSSDGKTSRARPKKRSDSGEV